MKLIISDQKSRGLTRFEVLVSVLLAILLLTILLAVVLPIHAAARRRAERIGCVENLKQIGTALSTWERENSPRKPRFERGDQANGFNDGQVAWIEAMGISNIVSSAKILHCPADNETPVTANSSGVKIRISYFLSLDASEGNPEALLSGDDNLEFGGAVYGMPLKVNGSPVSDVQVKPGILLLSSNTPVSWTENRHMLAGNISFCDGSVEQESSWGLEEAFQNSATNTSYVGTNRIAIP